MQFITLSAAAVYPGDGGMACFHKQNKLGSLSIEYTKAPRVSQDVIVKVEGAENPLPQTLPMPFINLKGV